MTTANCLVFVGVLGIASGLMLLVFYPMFANDSEQLSLEKEACINADNSTNPKCRGWFHWFEQVVTEEPKGYRLYHVSFTSCYKHIMAAGIVSGVGWLAAGIVGVALSHSGSKGLAALYKVLCFSSFIFFAILYGIIEYKISYFKANYFDRIKNDSERLKLAESSDGVTTVSVIVILLTSICLASTFMIDNSPITPPKKEQLPLNSSVNEKLLLNQEEEKS